MKLTDKIPSLPKLLLRIAGYSVAAVIVYALIHGFAMFRVARHTEDCSAATGRPTGDLSSLQRAKSIAACIGRHSGFPESLYFQPTLQMLANLPRTPCQYVGTWTSTRPESVYTVTLRDNGEFSADFVSGQSSDEHVTGTWSEWNRHLIWFYDQGVVWPPDMNPVIATHAAGFTLQEHNGTHTQFTWLDSVESKLCGTKATAVDDHTIQVVPDLPVAPSLDAWAGKFATWQPQPQSNDVMMLAIGTDGQFKAEFACTPVSGSSARIVEDSGYLQVADEWYQVNANSSNAAAGCRLPSRLFPLQWAGQRYLLSDERLALLVNRLNAGQAIDPTLLLQSTANEHRPAVWPSGQLPVLPKPYSDGIKQQALRGNLSAIGPVSAGSPQSLLQPGNGGSFRSRAKLGLGSRNGVFNGMLFYPETGPESLHVEVINSRLDQSDVRLEWQGNWKPQTTMTVTSRPTPKQ